MPAIPEPETRYRSLMFSSTWFTSIALASAESNASHIISSPCSSSVAFSAVILTVSVVIFMYGAIFRRFPASASVLYCPICAASYCCLLRLEMSTLSKSIRCRCPTPALASAIAMFDPRPPRPHTATDAAANRCWISSP